MTITKVLLENYKSHSRTEIPLRPLTVLVGPNSVGKTSVLEAIWMVVEASTASRHWFFDEQDTARIRRGTDRCEVQLSGEEGGASRLWVSIGRSERDPAMFQESIGWERGGKSVVRTVSAGQAKRVDVAASRAVTAMVGSATQLRLDADALAAPSTIELGESTTNLLPSGQGLAGVLALMQVFRRERFNAVVSAMKRMVPSLQAINIKLTKFNETRRIYDEHGESEERTFELDGAELYFDFVGGTDIAASAVSEGTLIALGVLTAAHQDGERRLMLLDDIERALHPRAQRELIRMLRLIIADNPQLQIIATSHSPYLVDEFEPEEVIVFAQRKDGTSAARPLSEHPRIKQALEVLTTGEFLAAEEEAWVTGESDG